MATMSCTDGTVMYRNREKEIQMCVLGVRSRVNTEGVSEVEAATGEALSAIAEPQPSDASSKAGEGATFVALLELENEEELDPFQRTVPT
jgi:hypothetical protein